MKKIILVLISFFTLLNTYSQTAEEFNRSGLGKDTLKDFKGAIDDYTKAIELNPKNADAYFYRGNSKAHLKIYK